MRRQMDRNMALSLMLSLATAALLEGAWGSPSWKVSLGPCSVLQDGCIARIVEEDSQDNSCSIELEQNGRHVAIEMLAFSQKDGIAWKLCLSEAPAPSRSEEQSAMQAFEGSSPWHVLRGPCKVRAADCVASLLSRFSQGAFPHDSCVIKVKPDPREACQNQGLLYVTAPGRPGRGWHWRGASSLLSVPGAPAPLALSDVGEQ